MHMPSGVQGFYFLCLNLSCIKALGIWEMGNRPLFYYFSLSERSEEIYIHIHTYILTYAKLVLAQPKYWSLRYYLPLALSLWEPLGLWIHCFRFSWWWSPYPTPPHPHPYSCCYRWNSGTCVCSLSNFLCGYGMVTDCFCSLVSGVRSPPQVHELGNT